MNRFIYACQIFAFSITLFCALPLQCMVNMPEDYDFIEQCCWDEHRSFGKENDPDVIERMKELNACFSTLKKYDPYLVKAVGAYEYNETHPLIGAHNGSLKKNFLPKILSYCYADNVDQKKALKQSMKNFLRISMTCRIFWEILSGNGIFTGRIIGQLCKEYPQSAKNILLRSMVNNMDDEYSYAKRRVPVSILMYSGANPNIQSNIGNYLLTKTIKNNDKELTELLLQHNADPNLKEKQLPIFFYAKNKELAELCINYKARLNMGNPNVLWHAIKEEYHADVIDLYLNHGADVKQLHPWDKSCLLHQLAKSVGVRDKDNFLNKVHLLLNAMQDMVNHKNSQQRTVIDIALEYAEKEKKYHFDNVLEIFITVCRDKGGLSTPEMVAQKELEYQFNCIICYEKKDAMLDVPCGNNHKERICIECYGKLLNTSDKCPLCRNMLLQEVPTEKIVSSEIEHMQQQGMQGQEQVRRPRETSCIIS